MTTEQIMKELEKKGSASIKKIFLNHGAKEPVFGVRVGDLKVIQKKVKRDHTLAMIFLQQAIMMQDISPDLLLMNQK